MTLRAAAGTVCLLAFSSALVFAENFGLNLKTALLKVAIWDCAMRGSGERLR